MFCTNTTPFYVIPGSNRFTEVKTDNKDFHNYLFTIYYSMSDSDRDHFDEAFCKMSNDSKWALYKSLGQAWRFSVIPMKPEIEKVIFNDPATIVFWTDGTKTVVKAVNEPFDPEKGLAMAIAKHALGNEGNYYNEFRKWLPEKPKKSLSDYILETMTEEQKLALIGLAFDYAKTHGDIVSKSENDILQEYEAYRKLTRKEISENGN